MAKRKPHRQFKKPTNRLKKLYKQGKITFEEYARRHNEIGAELYKSLIY